MIALIQRVARASVSVHDATHATIATGLLALVAAEREDEEAHARRLAERVLNYRIFADSAGRMNRSVEDIQGAVLAVPQFTLAADTQRGNRPGFSRACPSARAETLFDVFVAAARDRHRRIQTGIFGANMQVELVNDGPVTFWLRA